MRNAKASRRSSSRRWTLHPSPSPRGGGSPTIASACGRRHSAHAGRSRGPIGFRPSTQRQSSSAVSRGYREKSRADGDSAAPAGGAHSVCSCCPCWRSPSSPRSRFSDGDIRAHRPIISTKNFISTSKSSPIWQSVFSTPHSRCIWPNASRRPGIFQELRAEAVHDVINRCHEAPRTSCVRRSTAPRRSRSACNQSSTSWPGSQPRAR